MPPGLFVSRIFGGELVVPKGRVVAVVARFVGTATWQLYAEFFYEGRDPVHEDVIVCPSPDNLESTLRDVREALSIAVSDSHGERLREIVVEAEDQMVIDQKLAALFGNDRIPA